MAKTPGGNREVVFLDESEKLHTYLREHPQDSAEMRFLAGIAQPGMVAVDVGGHIGVAAVTLAARVGPTGVVHCFEPTDSYGHILNRNLRLNGLDNVQTHCIAVTDRAGECVMHRDGAATSIVPRPADMRFRVHSTTLDCFALQNRMTQIDLLNIDCEGSEMLVLQGSGGILRRGRPRVFIEIHHDLLPYFDHDVHDVIAGLAELGFTIQPLIIGERVRPTDDAAACNYLYATRGT